MTAGISEKVSKSELCTLPGCSPKSHTKQSPLIFVSADGKWHCRKTKFTVSPVFKTRGTDGKFIPTKPGTLNKRNNIHCAPLIFPSGTLQVTGKSDDRNVLTGGPQSPELVCRMVFPLFCPITYSKPTPAIIIFQNIALYHSCFSKWILTLCKNVRPQTGSPQKLAGMDSF